MLREVACELHRFSRLWVAAIILLFALDPLTEGTKGRLVLDGYSVALYESVGWDAQAIVDAEDSAAWFMWYESQSPIIADHCTQGFDVIKKCEIGDTCYIVCGDSIQSYVCVSVDPDGVNERTDMYLSSGYNFMRKNDPGYLFMYTCNKAGDPYHITVVVWALEKSGSKKMSNAANWCSGSTADFDSAGVGSSPAFAANLHASFCPTGRAKVRAETSTAVKIGNFKSEK